MAKTWQSTGARTVGNNDPKVSQYLKCWIKQGNTCVVGVIGEGTAKELNANWNSPFENDSVGSKFSKVGGVLQTGAITDSTSGMTSVVTFSSRQVWEGNQPHTFPIVLSLYALSNPKAEVEDAIMELEHMFTPEVNAMSPIGNPFSDGNSVGRTPSSIMINIGRNVVLSGCVIESLSVPLDGPRSRDGYLMKADVQLMIQSEAMLNRSQIASTYG
ncbi:hypothetical protein [Xenorhabdus sp. PB30.3]|uniref:hypothetical protein n=1 Tax=Xenorhabdus sp. PB30.3 TaxID=2788941 RepID=UPI001E579DE0|nr:hypothetical protein [Xenorhabdus sp. PB30.3]MCC8380441.1 hypothetical protein [Xenorhabdus sp. PB30.3]